MEQAIPSKNFLLPDPLSSVSESMTTLCETADYEKGTYNGVTYSR